MKNNHSVALQYAYYILVLFPIFQLYLKNTNKKFGFPKFEKGENHKIKSVNLQKQPVTYLN